MPFQTELKHYRNRAKLSQAELSRRAGFDHSYVSRLESGQHMISRKSLEIFGKALELTEDEMQLFRHSAGFIAIGDSTITKHPILKDIARALEGPKAQAIETALGLILQLAEA